MSTSPSVRPQKWWSPAPGDLAVISNGGGELALLDRRANVTAWCLPEVDGDPVVHELYDAPWRTAFEFGVEGQQYPDRRMEKSNNTLRSTWMTSTGLAHQSDCMVGSPTSSAGGQFARLLKVKRGSVDARMKLQLRWGHRGEVPVKWTVWRSGAGFTELMADVGDRRGPGQLRLFLSTNMQLELNEDGTSVTGRLYLGAKQSAFVWVGWNGHAAPTAVKEVKKLLDASEKGWLKWAQGLLIPDDEYAAVSLESATRLRALGHGDGPLLAAASHGLPEDDWREVARSKRAWDYRAVWLRDAGLAVTCLDALGDPHVLAAMVRWYSGIPDLLRNTKIMYYADGSDVGLRGEKIVEGLGHRGAIYRHGNGAGNQPQHDRWVYPLGHLWLLASRGHSIDLRLARGLAEQAAAARLQPCHGVWEVRRGELVVNAATQLLLAQALIYASKIFHRAGFEDLAREYRQLALEVKKWVMDNCVVDGVIVASPDIHVLDSSVLLAFLEGKDVFDLKDPEDRTVILNTLRAIDTPETDTAARFKGLRVGDGHVRYHQSEELNDGLSLGREGTFTNVTVWVAEMWLPFGELDRADALMRGVLNRRNDVGIYTEETTEDGVPLGNVSQAYVYLAVINYYRRRARFVAREADDFAIAA